MFAIVIISGCTNLPMKNDPNFDPNKRHNLTHLITDRTKDILQKGMNELKPKIDAEIEKYKDSQLRRLSVRPGITGLWQINGRNEIKKFEDWIKLDLEYIDNWSLLLDLKIVIKTIPTILKGTGK